MTGAASEAGFTKGLLLTQPQRYFTCPDKAAPARGGRAQLRLAGLRFEVLGFGY